MFFNRNIIFNIGVTNYHNIIRFVLLVFSNYYEFQYISKSLKCLNIELEIILHNS